MAQFFSSFASRTLKIIKQIIVFKVQCWKIAHASVYLVGKLCSKSQSSKSKIEKMFGNGGSKIDKNSFWDTGQIVKLIYSENEKDGD